MSHVLKSENVWRERLRKRGAYLQAIRDFFSERNILEVLTPVLMLGGVTDPNIHVFSCDWHQAIGGSAKTLYAQTSPEYAMKRLLAVGSGDIYQIAPACRDGELGKWHVPSFTLLEWYQLGLDHHGLMCVVDDLLQTVFQTKPALKLSYKTVFERYANCNPHEASVAVLKTAVEAQGIVFADLHSLDHNGLCDLLMVMCIEPKLSAFDQPVMIYDYPEHQAGLARIAKHPFPTASRFEVYWQGIELGNGYHELTCEKTQRERFLLDNVIRVRAGMPTMPLDEAFLSAMRFPGLPECAGVALGIDRLLMLVLGESNIDPFGFFSP